MNKDQVKGRIKEVEGKTKEVAGKVIGNKEMEVDGAVKKNAGKEQANVGHVRHDLKKHK
ncbi:CsbD family protein [Pandoraea sp. NPDC087047]|uniref:CsbD family protein n=1 Tax=Pandoraea sp. NPDC087047 TaxID=3364390 RepID=UPI0037F8D160